MSGESRRRPGPGVRAAVALCLLLLAGCGTPLPSPSARVSGPSSLGPLRGSPPAPPDIGGNGTPADPATLVDHGTLPGATNVLYLTTDGESVIWSGAAPRLVNPLHGPNLYRAAPGEGPQLLFAGPRSDSDLLPVAASHGWIAFAEENETRFGIGAWILWLLPPGKDEPIELDRTPPLNGSPLPLVAISDRHVVWQGIALGPDERRAELNEMSLPDMRRRTLFSDDPERRQWWDPALDGDRLVVTEVDYVNGDASSATHPAELYAMLLDLAAPAAAPIRLDTSGRAAEPAIHGDDVVWKEADDVFNYGALTYRSLADGVTRSILTAPQSRIKSPTVGNRYVAFWGIDDTKFFVYDMKREEAVPIFELAPDSPIGGAFRIEVAGDLLVWIQGTQTDPVIGWGRLPTNADP